MGIVAVCPNGHRIKVKEDLAGRKGICPTCSARFRIPAHEAEPSAAPEAGGHTRLPTARVVSHDPAIAASLPAARPFAAPPAPGRSVPAANTVEAPPVFVPVAAPPPPARGPVHAALGERPDLSWCVAVRGGEPSAPLIATAMRAWLDSGAATADHVVWRVDWPEWRSLGDVFPEALRGGARSRP